MEQMPSERGVMWEPKGGQEANLENGQRLEFRDPLLLHWLVWDHESLI